MSYVCSIDLVTSLSILNRLSKISETMDDSLLRTSHIKNSVYYKID